MPNGRMVFPRISHKDLTEDSSWTLALRAGIAIVMFVTFSLHASLSGKALAAGSQPGRVITWFLRADLNAYLLFLFTRLRFVLVL